MENFDKAKSCCFSGHRAMDFDMDLSQKGYAMQNALKNAVNQAITDGFEVFYGGLAQGFDIIAAETIMKEKYVRGGKPLLVSVAPFRGQELRWNNHWRARHDAVLRASDKIITLNDRFIKGCYHERNRFLIDHCARLIGFWSGKSGGTKHTFDYAAEKGIEVVNIFD